MLILHLNFQKISLGEHSPSAGVGNPSRTLIPKWTPLSNIFVAAYGCGEQYVGGRPIP